MRRLLSALVAACATVVALPVVVAPGASSAADPATALTIGREAYQYGFPLLESLRVRTEMTSVRCPDEVGNAPLNSFSHAREFADPTVRSVVAPNTDTLYSIAHLDLGRGPVVLRHPDMGRRYYSFAMLDPYTNVIAIPGSREDGPGASATQVRWTRRPGSTPASAYDRVVTSRYRYVWVIGRTLATGAADQRRAHRLMLRYTLTGPDGTQRTFPRSCRPGPPDQHPTPTDGAAFVRRLNTALAQSPPPARDDPLLTRLAAYGIGPGLSPEDAGLDPVTLEALYTGISTAAMLLPREVTVRALSVAVTHDGWFDPPPAIGRYGTDYELRAQIASAGLGANTREEATYPVGVTDGTGVLYVGANDYRLTFAADELPPARYFWSLTMYDGDGYLVPNDAGRYSVGPSHPPLVTGSDGSVVVVISQRDPQDETVNWLPAPGGQFRLNLRLYGPSQDALDGTWTPPPVENLGPGGLLG
ncbi:MAG: DUF1254 domain-containing protein [Actinobacteria bacterium]|uniref:Unannotated protein n=1 Tax=freshwater metagenome TaxID=449393 RepID=A0A6J6P6T7_9ZZZZ|nr:DUF1254 domain-containing protein [Actinomycetota bacterium]